MPNRPFPKDFVWGVATAATQIEGAAEADGKGPSIWDVCARRPGLIDEGHSPAVACDHYHRWPADLDLIRDLGFHHYRFSVAWPRILPGGDGAVNAAGLDFYDRLVDGMLARGIEPWCTMFHWDLPQALEDRGGWPARGTVDAFAIYADVLVKRLGDRVRRWFTINEPRSFIDQAYRHGWKAPFRREGDAVWAAATHHALLAHAHGVRAVRAHARPDAWVGFVFDAGSFVPLTADPADLAAARAAFVADNGRHLQPILAHGYPEAWLRQGGDAHIRPGDLDLIAGKVDFCGWNNYLGAWVRAGRDGAPEVLGFTDQHPRADTSWLRWLPQAIRWVVQHANEAYGPRPAYITENGCAYAIGPDRNGEVLDTDRITFLDAYLTVLQGAIAAGLDVRGYFHWSLMDNFEWERGYRQRFGMVHVAYETQRRTPKLSAHWLARLAANNAMA
jgi:beta-glucosidase